MHGYVLRLLVVCLFFVGALSRRLEADHTAVGVRESLQHFAHGRSGGCSALYRACLHSHKGTAEGVRATRCLHHVQFPPVAWPCQLRGRGPDSGSSWLFRIVWIRPLRHRAHADHAVGQIFPTVMCVAFSAANDPNVRDGTLGIVIVRSFIVYKSGLFFWTLRFRLRFSIIFSVHCDFGCGYTAISKRRIWTPPRGQVFKNSSPPLLQQGNVRTHDRRTRTGLLTVINTSRISNVARILFCRPGDVQKHFKRLSLASALLPSFPKIYLFSDIVTF